MENLKLLIEQLKAAGITPKVNLTISDGDVDISGIKSAQSKLQAAGITADIQVNIDVSAVLSPAPGPNGDITGEKSIAVVVNADKSNCMMFKSSDKAGKPIMEIREPRVQLFRGDRLRVSAEHKASDKDAGDGTVIGTGGFKYYFILDCPTRPDAKGLYVKESDVSVA